MLETATQMHLLSEKWLQMAWQLEMVSVSSNVWKLVVAEV